MIQSESNSTDPRIFSPEPDPFDSDCNDGQGQNYGHQNYLRDRNERFLFSDDTVKHEEDQRDFNDENGEFHVGDEPGSDLEDPDGLNTDFISSSLHSEGEFFDSVYFEFDFYFGSNYQPAFVFLFQVMFI